MRKLLLLALGLVSPFALFAQNQTIILRDGTTFTGRFTGGTETTVSFQDNNGDRHRFDMSEVQSLTFAPGNNAAITDNRNYRDRNTYNSGNRDYRTVPAGTQLSVRTNEAIDSRTAASGQTYAATITQDVMDSNGNVVIPQGSLAQMVIDNPAGAPDGGSNLRLDLKSVTVNGQRYGIETGAIVRSGNSGLGGNRRTAEMVGGGTALGTLLGAIGGGGKGALIGALAGAGTGAGVEVLTKGNRVTVPAETVLSFRLDQPLSLSPVRY